MEIPLEEQILNAIELFHYSYRFRDSTFCIVAGTPETLRGLLPDLKVLQSSRIQTVIVCRASDKTEGQFKRWGLRGYNFEYFSIGVSTSPSELPSEAIRSVLSRGGIPVVAVSDTENTTLAPCPFYDLALNVAGAVGATKAFFPGKIRGIEVDRVFQSHPSCAEIKQILSEEHVINVGAPFLKYLHERQQEHKFDIIVLESKSGTLFQEVFSHRGSGTLLTSDYPNIFRRAEPSDISDISLLMKPYVRSGAILPVTEAQVFADLPSYYVYTVNGQVVACAKLTDYGECCEIGKICTLPRYQRKGRAKAITEQVVKVAIKKKKRWVFSLSTQERMFVFFRQLGFQEISRSELPESWAKGYDFSRPSKAFRLDLPTTA